MKDLKENCRVAVVQAEPVLFDKKASVDKAVKFIEEAALKNPNLIVFPELFIPGYPIGMTFGFTIGKRDENGRTDWKRYYDNSILIPGPETKILGEAAKKAKAYLSIGVSERTLETATLYNTNIIFNPEGELVYIHRKIKPTGAERVLWGDADKHFFPTLDTEYGRMGSLICWESYMPLARVELYKQGMSIYISPNTNDNKEWFDTIKHIAIEGHNFFINCDMVVTKNSYPKDLKTYYEVEKLPENICRGGSCIVDPYGHYVTEPVFDKEVVIVADIDMNMVPMSRMEFDVCGHYDRPDLF